MISNIFFNKNLTFPHISFALFLSCTIISIPILFNDVLYAFLAANVGLAFPWQYLTSVFAHGPTPPLIIHLIVNLLAITLCVVLTEKLLGTWRVFVILIISVFVITFIRFETQNFENGVSYFVFAFIPFTFVILVRDFKNLGLQNLRNGYSILTLFLLFIVLIISPIYYSTIDAIFSEINLLHVISILIGIIFLLIWKKRFVNNLSELNQGILQKQKSVFERICRTLGYLITAINLLVLVVVLIFFD